MASTPFSFSIFQGVGLRCIQRKCSHHRVRTLECSTLDAHTKEDTGTGRLFSMCIKSKPLPEMNVLPLPLIDAHAACEMYIYIYIERSEKLHLGHIIYIYYVYIYIYI